MNDKTPLSRGLVIHEGKNSFTVLQASPASAF